MAQSYLPTYQIILFVIFGINVLFWVILFCWKFFCLDTMTNNLNRCRRALNSLANLSINVNQMHNFTIRGAVMKINSDLPPPYEQAIKYPSLTSISGQLNGNATYNLSSESNSNCLSSQLEPAPSYFESQISSLPLPQAPSSSSPCSSFISSLSSSSKKPIDNNSIFFSSTPLQRSFSFNDVESFKKLQQYLYNV